MQLVMKSVDHIQTQKSGDCVKEIYAVVTIGKLKYPIELLMIEGVHFVIKIDIHVNTIIYSLIILIFVKNG